MHKLWLAIIALTIFFSCEETSSNDNQLLDYLPSDASFILSTKNLDSLTTMLERNKLIDFDKDSKIYSSLRTIAKTVKPDSLWGKIYVAIKSNGNAAPLYAITYDTDSIIFIEDGATSFSAETLTSSRNKFQVIKADSAEVYIYNSSPTYVISNNKKWLEESISKFPLNNKIYKSHFETTSNNNSFIADNLGLTAKSIKTDKTDSLSKIIANKMILEFSLEDNSVRVNGIALSDSISPTLQNLNAYSKPRENKFAQISPYDVDFVQSFTFDSYENFQEIDSTSKVILQYQI